MNSDFSKLPHEPSIPLKPFKAHATDEQLRDLRRRVEDAPTPRKTYENSTLKEQTGITREWLVDAMDKWKSLDWRKTENVINSFPNFTAHLSHNEHEFDVHFVALFSDKKDATPLVMMHGWPGSFLEFIPLLQLLSTKYTPATLPVHLIVPSLIGFGYSSPPPIDIDFATRDNAYLVDQLMVGLGLEGYVAQGGDIGSFVARFISEISTTCAAVHLDFFPAAPPKGFDSSSMDELDKKCAEKCEYWDTYERDYCMEQANKTSTIAAVCETSPIALLGWIGEKFLVWTDEDPSTGTILEDVTLYWLTQSFPTSLYHYRVSYGEHAKKEDRMPPVKKVPLGYSQFRHEIMPSPKAWVEAGGSNLVWHRKHEKWQGGHFSALEGPAVLWDDVTDFIQSVVNSKP